jgi:predicted DNA-binding protein (MmcQ/YjbR family)
VLKLRDSLDEVANHGKHKVGAHGWVTVKVDDADAPQLERWIDESYRLVVGVKSKNPAG